jgi:hypothetical protein
MIQYYLVIQGHQLLGTYAAGSYKWNECTRHYLTRMQQVVTSGMNALGIT